MLPDTLAERGGDVEVLDHLPHRARRAGAVAAAYDPRPRGHRLITLTSSSAARTLVEAVGAEALTAIPVACIGPITADTARELGLDVVVEAEEHTLPGLLAALRTYAAGAGGKRR